MVTIVCYISDVLCSPRPFHLNSGREPRLLITLHCIMVCNYWWHTYCRLCWPLLGKWTPFKPQFSTMLNYKLDLYSVTIPWLQYLCGCFPINNALSGQGLIYRRGNRMRLRPGYGRQHDITVLQGLTLAACYIRLPKWYTTIIYMLMF